MREWAAPEKADIIVSELLGSFGDNELSPECLDGAQHFLKGKHHQCVSCDREGEGGLWGHFVLVGPFLQIYSFINPKHQIVI